MSQNLSLVRTMGDDPHVKRNVVIKLLVTQPERDAMQAAANKEKVTLSEWIRSRCITTTVVAVDHATLRAAFIARGEPTPRKKGSK